MTHLQGEGICGRRVTRELGPTNIKRRPFLAIQQIQHSDVAQFYAVFCKLDRIYQIYLSLDYSDFFICHYKYLHTSVTSGRMKVLMLIWRLGMWVGVGGWDGSENLINIPVGAWPCPGYIGCLGCRRCLDPPPSTLEATSSPLPPSWNRNVLLFLLFPVILLVQFST